MNKQVFFKSVYEEFWTLINEKRINLPGKFLVYEDYLCQSSGEIYGEKEQDSTRELLNTINQFSSSLNKLTLWNEIISNYVDIEHKLDLDDEFVKYLVYYCLHQPYEFKQRLIFLATDLCYTEGLNKRLLTEADIEDDKDININSLKKVVKYWQNGQTLLNTIDKIDGTEFRKETKYYRHRSQHRVPPQIEIGINPKWVRSFSNSGGIAYSFQVEEALKIPTLIPLLKEELNLMINSFEAFRSLINEHTNPK